MDSLKQEFVNLMKALGWTQAETARQLCMTSGAVNQIVNPKSAVRPSPTTLRLFKLMVVAEEPDAFSSQSLNLRDEPRTPDAPEAQLLEMLRRVPPERRALALEAVGGVLAAFDNRVTARRRKKSAQ